MYLPHLPWWVGTYDFKGTYAPTYPPNYPAKFHLPVHFCLKLWPQCEYVREYICVNTEITYFVVNLSKGGNVFPTSNLDFI